MSQTQIQQLGTVGQFLEEHYHMLNQALTTYIAHMREAADKTMKQYDAIKDDAAKRAAQNASLITTEGLRTAAGSFNQAADQAEKTRDDLDAVYEALGDF